MNSYGYDFNIFMNRMKEFQSQLNQIQNNDKSAKKVLEALKDTADFFDKLSELGSKEREMYFNLLFNSLACSYVMNNRIK